MFICLKAIIIICAVQVTCAQGPKKGYEFPRDEVIMEHLEALDRITADLDSICLREIVSINIYRAQYPETASLWPILDRLESLFLERERLLYSVTSSSPGVARINHSINVSKNDLQKSIAALRETMQSRLPKNSIENPHPVNRNP